MYEILNTENSVHCVYFGSGMRCGSVLSTAEFC